MDILLVFKSVLMGIVEGLTEFLPISSTGHLILAGNALQFPERIASTFEIFIQLGAIIAVVIYFARDLFALLKRALHRDPAAMRLLVNVLVAFIPAAVVGLIFRKQIKAYLFSPFVVALSLVVGGIAMLLAERYVSRQKKPYTKNLEYGVSLRQSVGIGIAQIVSLVPGMSRAAWTIIGGLLMNLDRVTATRFSFYLAIPTLGAASIYDLYKSLDQINAGDISVFAVGLLVSFVVALLVIKFLLNYVARHDFKPFAWYRIAIGAVMAALFLPM